jgi:hypothetical protein
MTCVLDAAAQPSTAMSVPAPSHVIRPSKGT